MPKRLPPLPTNTFSSSTVDDPFLDFEPPTVPRAKASNSAMKGKSPGRAQALRVSPSSRETFLDDITPTDNTRTVDDALAHARDSHDLAISPQRESLVDNMVLSLDQLNPGNAAPAPGQAMEPGHTTQLYSTDNDPEQPLDKSRSNSFHSGRPRGHTHSSSYSSEYDLPAHDASSRYSTLFHRSRRSNSSSNFQAVLERIDSLRGSDKARGKTSEAQRATPPRTKPPTTHSRGAGKKGSRGSGSSSLDMGNRLRSNDRHRGPATDTGGSSLEADVSDRILHTSQSEIISARVAANNWPQSGLYTSYDAAPTPTVPAGPRGPWTPDRQSVLPPQPTHAPPKAPLKNDTDVDLHDSMDTRDGEAVELRDRGLPPLPVAPEAPAPGPTIAYRKTSNPEKDATKERPGFFRRVFGSSKNSSPANPRSGSSSRTPVGTPSPGQRSQSQGKLSHLADQMRPFSQASKPDASAVPPKDPPQVLNKKASFFRRRKKSVSEVPAPPPPVPDVHQQETYPITPPRAPNPASDPKSPAEDALSPVSSLRKVMNPYLRTPISPLETYDSREQLDGGRDGRLGHAAGTSRATSDMIMNSKNEQMGGRPLDGAVGPPAEGIGLDHGDHNLGSSIPRLLDDARDRPGAEENARDSTAAKETSVAASRGTDDHTAAVNHSETYPANSVVIPKRKDSLSGTKRYTARTPPLLMTAVPPQSPSQTSDTTTIRQPSYNAITADPSGTTEQADAAVSAATPGHDVPGRGGLAEDTQVTVGQSVSEGHSQLPLDRSRESPLMSPISDYQSASSLPIVQGDDEPGSAEVGVDRSEVQPTITMTGPPSPTQEDREKAKQVFDGAEDSVTKDAAAAWLGESGSEMARKAYMELFDWSDMNILTAMRDLCGRLILKGETQQVDRILDSFASRWCECNPNHGFKAVDVVHTISYSILLLNTDLHLADIEQKMTRSQFVKNTMPTIHRVAIDAAPTAFPPKRTSTFMGNDPALTDFGSSGPRSGATFPRAGRESRTSVDIDRPSYRSSRRPSVSEENGSRAPTPLMFESTTDDCGPLVKAPFNGSIRTWEVQVEIVLRDFYNSIRTERLPLHGAAPEQTQDAPCPTNSLSVLTSGMLRRSPSTLSRAGSENLSCRGRPELSRVGTGRWNSKARSRPRLYPRSTVGSSRTSLDDESTLWSASASSTWSRYSFGKTQTSMSVDSLGSNLPQGDYQQSIGFANALSQAIIREETADSLTPPERVSALLEDETLGLAGAPWAKEGILKHKHHLDSVDKKAKDRNWNECFAVIEKGWMRLFSFTGKSSVRSRTKNRQPSGGVVGGGNWSENAEALGSFLLRQTIASALPPPGYSKTRPHVWALSLPTGAVHLFQVGTPEIVKEFVSTANYWSARLSKEPLVGGVSNIEYGWSESIISTVSSSLGAETPPGPTRGHQSRPSLQSSIRSSLDQSGSARPKLPGDKVVISDWSPPQQSMMASQLLEVDQLNGLQTYVKNIEEELQRHNELRSPMLLAFSTRHANSQKAMTNWERKSSYLLREIVKFRTYIDCLMQARERKKVIYEERRAKKAGDDAVAGEQEKAVEMSEPAMSNEGIEVS